MSIVTEVLTKTLAIWNRQPDPETIGRFEMYHALLTERNRLMDLSNVPDDEMPERHYADSILPLLRYPGLIASDADILDVGSGAGLPGIPLAIMLPRQRVTLLEANGRRCDFLREVTEKLGLAEVSVLEGRAETMGQDNCCRESFDVVVSRAVAALPELLEYMLPFARTGGRALCWKGRRAEEEMAAAAHAAAELGDAALSALPYGDNDHESMLIVAEKRRGTPDAYPRRTGIPHKRPIM